MLPQKPGCRGWGERQVSSDHCQHQPLSLQHGVLCWPRFLKSRATRERGMRIGLGVQKPKYKRKSQSRRCVSLGLRPACSEPVLRLGGEKITDSHACLKSKPTDAKPLSSVLDIKRVYCPFISPQCELYPKNRPKSPLPLSCKGEGFQSWVASAWEPTEGPGHKELSRDGWTRTSKMGTVSLEECPKLFTEAGKAGLGVQGLIPGY